MATASTTRAQERIACELISRCEPNLRALLVADMASGDPSRMGVVAWLNENGSLDDSNRITCPARVMPAPIVYVKADRTSVAASKVTVKHAETRTRYPCREHYVPDADKPDETVFCGKFHADDEPHGKNRGIRRHGFAW